MIYSKVKLRIRQRSLVYSAMTLLKYHSIYTHKCQKIAYSWLSFNHYVKNHKFQYRYDTDLQP